MPIASIIFSFAVVVCGLSVAIYALAVRMRMPDHRCQDTRPGSACAARRVAWKDAVRASPLQLPIAPTLHTAQVVPVLRRARALVPRPGSVAGLVHAADPDRLQPDAARAEALAALRVGALVFGHDDPAEIGAHDPDAAGVVDIAVYHLTGAPADVDAALRAFRRAAGPLLPAPLG